MLAQFKYCCRIVMNKISLESFPASAVMIRDARIKLNLIYDGL